MKKWKGELLTVVLTTILLFFYYTGEITNANNTAYGQWGDGYKNYYTLAYYLKYDSGSHFTGMNYPYGENVMFTDNQPIIAWLLKPLVYVFPCIVDYLHGIIIWALFLSIILAALFIFRILNELEVGLYNSILFATYIALLSPQLARIQGHFSLGYACFIPMVLLYLIQYFKSDGSKTYFIKLLFTITFFGFIHVYYVAMAGVFLLTIVTLYTIFNIKQWRGTFKFVWPLVTAALSPLLILKLFLFFTDNITDRPQSPWGFIESGSSVFDILLSPNSFAYDLFNRFLPNIQTHFSFEGAGYIGIVAAFFFINTVCFLLIGITQGKFLLKSYKPYNYLLPAATLVLLFAMAFPFSTFPGTVKYYELLPSVIKQFRAAGRFNWIFYYTITTFVAVIIDRTFSYWSSKNKLVAVMVLAISHLAWFCDAATVSLRFPITLKYNRAILYEKKEAVELRKTLSKIGKSTDAFQGILPIPFFLNGSEKIYIESISAYPAMKTSLYTGLPLVCGQLSRTSERQTFKIARLLSNDIMPKEILKEYKNDKPLLVVSIDDKYTPNEQALLKRCNLLFTLNKVHYYELPLSAFRTNDFIRERISKTLVNYISQHDTILLEKKQNTILKRFENEPKDYAVFGQGATYSEKGPVYFYFDTIPNALQNETYEISVWVYSDNRRAAFPTLYFTQIDTSGNELEKKECNPKFELNTYGKWVRVDGEILLRNRKNKIYAVGLGDFGSYDEFMIRPINSDIITGYENDTVFMYNNFPIRKQ